jgi:GTP pyrophosphokinase
MNGAIVNGRIVPYGTALQNGDIVEVLTSKSSKGPSRDWLGIIKSPEARNKIRQWFKREKRDENIIHGRLAFEAELRHANLKMSDVTRDDVLPRVLEKLSFPTLDDALAAIGYGGLSAQKAVNKIRDDVLQIIKSQRKEERGEGPKLTTASKTVAGGVIVEGLDNCLIKFAKCCSPVPGDPVIGFVTRGYGVSVHHGECPNYLRSRGNPDEAGRWLNVMWANSEKDVYSSALSIVAHARPRLILDITTAMAAMKVKMTEFSARDSGGVSTVHMTVEVKNSEELGEAMARLGAVSGVVEIRRGE